MIVIQLYAKCNWALSAGLLYPKKAYTEDLEENIYLLQGCNWLKKKNSVPLIEALGGIYQVLFIFEQWKLSATHFHKYSLY